MNNLSERLTLFSEKIIYFLMTITQNCINRPIITQLVRSATSIGANYCEAQNACSKKDFRNKIFICKKEAQEASYWLRLICKTNPQYTVKITELNSECRQIVLIMQSIINKTTIN